jgi:hypothetical protein
MEVAEDDVEALPLERLKGIVGARYRHNKVFIIAQEHFEIVSKIG